MFRSYFENEHGEQWIFEHTDGKSTVRAGDIGSDLALTVERAAKVLEGYKRKKSRPLKLAPTWPVLRSSAS